MNCAKVQDQKERLLTENLHLVKIIAHQVAAGLPSHVDMNDLVSAGNIGLLEAAERFDGSMDVQFNTYASIRIRGAILDELRQMDWMTRSMRDKSNRLEKAQYEIERKTGRSADSAQIANFMGISQEEVNTIQNEITALSVLSLEDLGIMRNGDNINILEYIKNPDAKDPVAYINHSELKKRLSEAIMELSEKEQIVVSLHYYDELTHDEIGKVLNLTGSRVCQINRMAILSLKEKMKSRLLI